MFLSILTHDVKGEENSVYRLCDIFPNLQLIVWRKYFSICFQYISLLFFFCIFKNSTLHTLTQNLGILKEAKNENMFSYSVIHLTSPFPDFQRCVNLSAALEVSVMNSSQNSSMLVETLGVAGFES